MTFIDRNATINLNVRPDMAAGRTDPSQGMPPGAAHVGESGAISSRGALAPFAQIDVFGTAGNALGVTPGFMAGMPQPLQGSVGAVALTAAASKLDDNGTFSMVEITALIFQTNKQTRTLQRNDMIAAMDAQAQISEKSANNMREAASARFTGAIISAAVNIAGSVAAMGSAVKIQRDAVAMATSQAMSTMGSSVGGIITAGYEVKATEFEAQNKILDATNSRLEKVYQESNSMLGDLKENMQIARDTLRGLLESQASNRIAGNF